MITFISLFLGLIVGEYPVEVQPTEGVVRVEIVLDGAPVAEMTAEPWVSMVNFGAAPLPHRLEAVAYDSAGTETGRVTQWINLVRSPAEASLNLELDPEGISTRVAVTWEAVEGETPRNTRVELDGALLPVENVEQFELPRYDPNQLHFLRVELDFADEVVAVAEATFGGFYTDSVNTELTSVVIDVGRDRKMELSDLSGQFLIAGKLQDPVAVEKGSAEIMVVRDVQAQPALRTLYSKARSLGSPKAPKDTFLRHYWTRPRESVVGERRYLLHPHSGDQQLYTRNLLSSFLADAMQPSNQRGIQHIAGASAVAGMASVSRNRRRVVLVVLGLPGGDDSFYSAESIRNYLGALDVPLEVWTTEGKAWRQTPVHQWGEIVEVEPGYRLYRAITQLFKGLENQRVVWFAGRHLPQDIKVKQSASFRRLGAGRLSDEASSRERDSKQKR